MATVFRFCPLSLMVKFNKRICAFFYFYAKNILTCFDFMLVSAPSWAWAFTIGLVYVVLKVSVTANSV